MFIVLAFKLCSQQELVFCICKGDDAHAFLFNFLLITAGTNRSYLETSIFSQHLPQARQKPILAIEKKLQLSSAENLALQEIK